MRARLSSMSCVPTMMAGRSGASSQSTWDRHPPSGHERHRHGAEAGRPDRFPLPSNALHPTLRASPNGHLIDERPHREAPDESSGAVQLRASVKPVVRIQAKVTAAVFPDPVGAIKTSGQRPSARASCQVKGDADSANAAPKRERKSVLWRPAAEAGFVVKSWGGRRGRSGIGSLKSNRRKRFCELRAHVASHFPLRVAEYCRKRSISRSCAAFQGGWKVSVIEPPSPSTAHPVNDTLHSGNRS